MICLLERTPRNIQIMPLVYPNLNNYYMVVHSLFDQIRVQTTNINLVTYKDEHGGVCDQIHLYSCH